MAESNYTIIVQYPDIVTIYGHPTYAWHMP